MAGGRVAWRCLGCRRLHQERREPGEIEHLANRLTGGTNQTSAPEALGGTTDLKEDPDAGGTEKAAVGEVERNRVMAATQFFLDRTGQFARVLGIKPARYGKHEGIGGLMAAD